MYTPLKIEILYQLIYFLSWIQKKQYDWMNWEEQQQQKKDDFKVKIFEIIKKDQIMWTFNQKLYQILRYYKRYERVFLLFFCQNNKWISVCWSNPRFFHMGGSMGGFYHNSINVWNEITRLLWLMLHEELWLEFILLINLSMVGISGQSRFLD